MTKTNRHKLCPLTTEKELYKKSQPKVLWCLEVVTEDAESTYTTQKKKKKEVETTRVSYGTKISVR